MAMDLTPKKSSAPWKSNFLGCCRGSGQQSPTDSQPSGGCEDENSTAASISDASAPEVGATVRGFIVEASAPAPAYCREGEASGDVSTISRDNYFLDEVAAPMCEDGLLLLEKSCSFAGSGGSILAGTSDDATGDEACHRYADSISLDADSISLDEDNFFKLPKVCSAQTARSHGERSDAEEFTVNVDQASRCTDQRVNESTHQRQMDPTFCQLVIVALLRKLFGQYVFGPLLTMRSDLMTFDKKQRPTKDAESEAHRNALESKDIL